MTYGSEENKQAIQELATIIDDAIKGWMASRPTASVGVGMKVAIPVRPGGLVDVSTFFGDWEGCDLEGNAWAKGLSAHNADAPPLNRAQRRRRGN